MNPLSNLFGNGFNQQPQMPMQQQPQPQMPTMDQLKAMPRGNLMQMLSAFASGLRGDPSQIANILIQSGAMSKEQFAEYAKFADQVTGRR